MDVVHEGVSLGALNIEYSDALVQSRLKQTVFYYLAMLAALLTVLGVIVFWTSFSITRPLYQIVDLVRQISASEPEGDAKIVVQRWNSPFCLLPFVRCVANLLSARLRT